VLIRTQVSCIGCGKCVRACPGAFYVEASYYGRARVVPGADVAALADEVDIAMETCPVDCIHRVRHSLCGALTPLVLGAALCRSLSCRSMHLVFLAPKASCTRSVNARARTPTACIHTHVQVTSPQLALLEAALSGMQRVDAFLMLRQQRATGNVFDEAERAWQKRQAVLAALRRQHEASVQSQGWAGIWSAHVEMRRPGDAGGVGGGGSDDADAAAARDPARRRVADLAASASRAMRRWRAAAALSSPHKALAE
jgi:ferredoxin